MKLWNDFFKPIVVLGVICIVTSALLAVTNGVTAPIIEQNAIATANATRAALLPKADGFEAITLDVEGVTEAYKATNDAGYVITAAAKGYAGDVPVMVAFNADGKILAVNFLANAETPGLGQKVRTDAFQGQFNGKDAENFGMSDIDGISGATISTSAAVKALNAAITAYKAENGVVEVVLTPEEQRAVMLPDAGAITPLDALPEGVKEGYKGEVYGTILYTEVPGFYKKPLTAAVAFDDAGVITGVWFDTSQETEGVGDQVGNDKKFAEQFIGKTSADGTDAVAGATVSSTAAMDAVNLAVEAYKTMKGA